MKDALGKKNTEFATLWPKTYSYLKDNNDEDKKAKYTKKCHKKKTEIWRLQTLFWSNST